MMPKELQDLFNQEIPITKSMGLDVVKSTSDEVILEFKLDVNKNHKGTAFGGSQYSACALSCYGLFLVGLRERGYTTNNIVISDGKISYDHPVGENFIAKASWSLDSQTEFFDKLSRKQKAKVTLNALVEAKAKVCTSFEGDFVAILDR
jgi:thioesterase domain-containing protein